MSRIEFTANQVCTGQLSDSGRTRDQWQCAAVTPQFNLSFSFVSRFSKHLVEFIDAGPRELIVGIVVSAIAVFRPVDNILVFTDIDRLFADLFTNSIHGKLKP